MRLVVLSSLLIVACTDTPGGPGVSPVVVVEVAVDPTEPTTEDDLVALGSAQVAGQPTALRFMWERDGANSSYSGDTVPSTATMKGQTWTVLAWPEGGLPEEGAEASVTIANTPPVATVSIEPINPRITDDLEVQYSATDPDSDSVGFTFAWTRDGQPVPGDTDTIREAETSGGERWEVTVTPNDGESDGEPVVAGVTIENRAPVIAEVMVDPREFRHGEPITADVDAYDPDGDELTYTYQWYLNGAQLPEETQEGLDGSQYVYKDEIRVEVVASDGGLTYGPTLSSKFVTQNSAPTITSAKIVANDGVFAGKGIKCEASGMADVDGGTPSARYRWVVDGIDRPGTADLSIKSPRGTSIFCRASAWDGVDESAPVDSAPVVVQNTAPSRAVVRFTPSPPKASDTLTATPSGSVDLDGDTISYTYDWTVNGSGVSGSSSTLDLSSYKKKDLVGVTVTPSDGIDDGLPTTSTIAIAPSTPTKATVTLDPSAPDVTDTVEAKVSGSVDVDGDTITYAYQWKVAGRTVSEKSAKLKLSAYSKGDAVSVTVTPSDEDGAGPSTTAGVTVVNAPPTAPSAPGLPFRPSSSDNLLCTIGLDATDPDGDRLTYSARWERQDGWRIDDMTAYATGTRKAFMSSSWTGSGETWRCSVEVTDGSATTASGKTSTTIR